MVIKYYSHHFDCNKKKLFCSDLKSCSHVKPFCFKYSKLCRLISKINISFLLTVSLEFVVNLKGVEQESNSPFQPINLVPTYFT